MEIKWILIGIIIILEIVLVIKWTEMDLEQDTNKGIKMNIEDFEDVWEERLTEFIKTLPTFVLNMKHLDILDKPFVEWIETWLAWMELSSEEDIKVHYGE